MRNLSFGKYYEFSLGILIFLLVLAPSLIGIGVLFFIGVWVLGLIKKKFQFNFFGVHALLFTFYIAYLIGVFYTDHVDLANKYLEYKLALVLFPVVLSFTLKDKISIPIISSFMIIATLIISIIGAVNSLLLFSETGEMSSLLSANFSVIHHPTYLSAFAAMCCALLIYGLKMKWDYYSQHRVIALFVMFVGVQFFCISLAGILFLLMYLIYLTFSRVREVLSKRMFVGFTIAVFISLFCIVRFTPDVGDQLVNSVDYLIEYVDDPDEFIKSKQTSIGGSETRLILWTAAFYVYLEHPFGVGTANVDDYMTDMLYRIGQPHMAVKKLNPHNQYLQTAVEIGSIGLLILFSIIFYGCYYAIKKKNWILLFVILNLAFNCLFESMLQRQSGIVFYTFWICLLAPVKLNPKNELVKG